MSRSSRSTSSYSSDKIPLSIQSDPKQQPSYNSTRYSDPRYASSTLGEPRSGYSSNSSSSKSSRSSSSDLKPLSITRGPASQENGNSKRNDERYYPNSFLDAGPSQKKPLSCQKDNDARYYRDSSYYR